MFLKKNCTTSAGLWVPTSSPKPALDMPKNEKTQGRCCNRWEGRGEGTGGREARKPATIPLNVAFLPEPKLGKHSHWLKPLLKLVWLTSLWQLSFRSLHLDLIVEMDSMNEVLCDLSARLGHEMKLKDEQNQAIEHLLCGWDVFVVLPNDFGKSLLQLFVKILARNRSS